MKRLWLLPLLAATIALASCNRNTVPESTQAEGDTTAPAVATAPQPAEPTPLSVLLDPGLPSSGIQPMQAGGGTLPKGWKPDPPLDLSGDMPSDEAVRASIVKAIVAMWSVL